MIRSLTVADIPELERVQNATLPGSLPTLFGSRFFHLYCRSLMAEPQFLADGFFWNSRMAGFLSYTTDSAALLSAALRRHLLEYCFTTGVGVLLRPQRMRTILRLLPGVLFPGGQPGSEVQAELLSFGVLPEFRRGSEFYARQKTHVAMELLHHAFAELSRKGSKQVKIFIQREDVNPVINQFYQREGFRPLASTRRLGFACNHMVRDL